MAQSAGGVTRRDLLKIGGGFLVGIAAGYGLFQLARPAAQVVTSTVTETVTSSATTSGGGPKKSTFKLAVVTFTSGAASVFGVPAANMAKYIVDKPERRPYTSRTT